MYSLRLLDMHHLPCWGVYRFLCCVVCPTCIQQPDTHLTPFELGPFSASWLRLLSLCFGALYSAFCFLIAVCLSYSLAFMVYTL